MCRQFLELPAIMAENSRQPTLHRQVFDAVADSFMRGDFRPADHLTIRQIAARVGTSTMPVREAVRRLAALGAIEVHPRRHLSVPAISAESYIEVAEMRKLLEGRATFLACQRATKQDIAAVSEIHAQLMEAARSTSRPRQMRLNQQFHFAVYRLAGSELLLETITQLWLRVGPHLAHLFDKRDNVPKGVHRYFSEHEALIDALAKRDAQAAVAAIVGDIDNGTALFLESLRTSEGAGQALSLVTGTLPKAVTRPRRKA
jgi:DNA-binding GntR family transcriptional regulator